MANLWAAFWLSFGVVFVAELGDKSQLMALTFATKYRPALVMTGIVAATVLINAISVGVGYGLGLALPTRWISLVAGLLFLGFALWTLRGEDEEDDEVLSRVGSGPARGSARRSEWSRPPHWRSSSAGSWASGSRSVPSATSLRHCSPVSGSGCWWRRWRDRVRSSSTGHGRGTTSGAATRRTG